MNQAGNTSVTLEAPQGYKKKLLYGMFYDIDTDANAGDRYCSIDVRNLAGNEFTWLMTVDPIPASQADQRVCFAPYGGQGTDMLSVAKYNGHISLPTGGLIIYPGYQIRFSFTGGFAGDAYDIWAVYLKVPIQQQFPE